MNATRAAIVIDQSDLFRLGIETVLADLDFLVSSSTSKASEGIFLARRSDADLVIVGKTPDLKRKNALSEIRSRTTPPKVLFLVDQVDESEVARLVSEGVDGLLLRTVSASDLSDSIESILEGNRVVAPALTAGSIGRLGPTAETSDVLSPKELVVLAELASGSTYDEIASSLIVTKATVKTHLVHIYAKLEVANRNEAVAKAVAMGLLG